MTDRIILSGCSGGGKTTLVDALRRRGEAVVAEPGRRIVAQEQAGGGGALPWVDLEAFARRAVAMALADLDTIDLSVRRVFFDRGLVDAAVALDHATGGRFLDDCPQARSFASPVFLAPPWPEIYGADEARRHGFEAAVAEYDRLEVAYRRLGYRIAVLPKAPVEARVDFVLEACGDA